MSPEYRRKNSGDLCADGTNFDPARPYREILTDYRKVLESVYQPAAHAIDRLMSRRVNSRLSMTTFSSTSARNCIIGSLRPLPKRSASLGLTALNCAERLIVSTHRDRLVRGLRAWWTFRGGSSNRSTVVWPLWTVNIAPHFLG